MLQKSVKLLSIKIWVGLTFHSYSNKSYYISVWMPIKGNFPFIENKNLISTICKIINPTRWKSYNSHGKPRSINSMKNLTKVSTKRKPKFKNYRIQDLESSLMLKLVIIFIECLARMFSLNQLTVDSVFKSHLYWFYDQLNLHWLLKIDWKIWTLKLEVWSNSLLIPNMNSALVPKRLCGFHASTLQMSFGPIGLLLDM